MNREANRYDTALRERLELLRQDKLEFIGAGVDIEMYRHWTGYLRCLKEVLEIMTEIKSRLDK